MTFFLVEDQLSFTDAIIALHWRSQKRVSPIGLYFSFRHILHEWSKETTATLEKRVKCEEPEVWRQQN